MCQDDCGLMMLQYVRMDGWRNISDGEIRVKKHHIPFFFERGQWANECLAVESIVMPLHYIIRG